MSEQKFPPSAEVIDAETSVVAAEVAAEKAKTEIDNNVRLRKVGKQLTVLICVLVCMGVFGCVYHFKAIEKVNNLLNLERLQREAAVKIAENMSVENAELNIKINGQKKGIARRDEQILSLHKAAEREKQIHHEYYKHMRERAEGLTDHIMTLHAQLDAKDVIVDHQIKLANTKNRFMEIVKAITADNPVMLKKVLKDEDFPKMPSYKLGVELAIGLQAFNVLEWIQTLDAWDFTITDEVATRVHNPKTVPLADYQALKSAYDQQAGRLADIKYSFENQKLKLLSLEHKFRELNDEDKASFAEIIKNLPFSQKAAWDHYANQLEKHGEKKVHDYFEQEAKKNPKQNEESASSCEVKF